MVRRAAWPSAVACTSVLQPNKINNREKTAAQRGWSLDRRHTARTQRRTPVLFRVQNGFSSSHLGVIVSERLYLGKQEQAKNVIDHGRGTYQLSNRRGKLPNLAEELRAEAEAGGGERRAHC